MRQRHVAIVDSYTYRAAPHDEGAMKVSMETTIYSDGTYFRNNPDWHVDDSAWKARHIAEILRRNTIVPRTICEIGCGAGEVLRNLARHVPGSTRLVGYDISPDAYRLCAPKAAGNVEFRLGNLLDEAVTFDLAMAIDVFEHVEDYFDFLRRLRTKASFKAFHIPLDLSALALLRGSPLLHARRSVGHIHYFSKETALAALEDTGYEVMDWRYTCGRTELPNRGWKTRLLKGPRQTLFRMNADMAARTLGGYSLMVLAR
jgi:cyclopropane fatty-acyl-phospholipid synthase-like methyltransferase